MGINLLLDGLPECGDVVVDIDVSKFNQVIMNLIGNALKFTPRGGTVTVSLNLLGAQQVVQLRVKDTGVGIAQVIKANYKLLIVDSCVDAGIAGEPK